MEIVNVGPKCWYLFQYRCYVTQVWLEYLRDGEDDGELTSVGLVATRISKICAVHDKFSHEAMSFDRV